MIKTLFNHLDAKMLTGLLAGSLVFFLNVGGVLQTWDSITSRFPAFRNWILMYSNVVLLTLLVVLLCVSAALLLENRDLKTKLNSVSFVNMPRKIVLFLSPCAEGSFYLQHFSYLLREAAARANAELEMQITFYCPQQAFAGTDPECLQEAVKMFPGKVSGVFMIPANPDATQNLEKIRDFKSEHPATVLLDVYPGVEADPTLPDFAGCDEVEGGRVAGQLAIDYLNMHATETVSILILKGRSTHWELQRVTSFKETLIAKFGDKVRFEITDDLNYSREQARKRIEHDLDKCLRCRVVSDMTKTAPACMDYNIIYACNDDMAMGAVDAIDKVDKGLINALPKVIGYDGTDEMKNMIKGCNPHVIGTVDVHIDVQARRAMDAMIHLLRADRPSKQMNLIKPTAVYPRIRI